MNQRIVMMVVIFSCLLSYGSEWTMDSGGANPKPITIAPKDEWDSYYTNLPKDTVGIIYATVEGHLLNIRLEFIGGCEKHRFEILAWDHHLATNPPGIRVCLGHDSAGDACKALVSRQMIFDLRPLKAKYNTEDYNFISRMFIELRIGDQGWVRLVNPPEDYLTGDDYVAGIYIF